MEEYSRFIIFNFLFVCLFGGRESQQVRVEAKCKGKEGYDDGYNGRVLCNRKGKKTPYGKGNGGGQREREIGRVWFRVYLEKRCSRKGG